MVIAFHRAELANAIFQWVFRGKISTTEAEVAFADFEDDCRMGVWLLTGLPKTAYEASVRLGRQHGPSLGVRTLDTLHAAAALELKAKRFWTLDDRRAKLAQAEGLATA